MKAESSVEGDKKLSWLESQSSFKYNGKPVTRKKFIFKTIFGTFEVFEAVGGNCFIRHPFLKSNYIIDLSGLGGRFKGTYSDNGLEEWFGKSKAKCRDVETGIKECERVMCIVKKTINSY